MATSAKKAQDLAEALLGIGSESHSVDEVMSGAIMAAHKKTGGIDLSSVTGFYAKNKKPVMIGAAVTAVAVVGMIGFAWYKKWHTKEDKSA